MCPMDETLEEMEGYVSYFEDIPVEWLKPGESRFTWIVERLQRLKESLSR
jgi:hypothetical protein